LCAAGVAGKLLAVDGVPERRRLAEALGAEAVEPERAADVVVEATAGQGADVVIEAAGSPGGLDASLRLARGRGVVSVVGAHFEPTTPPEAKKLMVDYLDRKHLSYHWVACLQSGRSFHGAAIVRCNVNFGDPHIEAYCIVLREGKLYSDHDDRAIPCQRDNR